MLGLAIGTFVLSVIHSSLPNHWLPIVLIAKSEGWGRGRVVFFTALLALSHTLSTVLIGLIIGFIGYTISQYHEILSKLVASLVLVILGIFYISRHFRFGNPHHHGFGVFSFFGLLVAMFFSPCVEIEAYYLSAGVMGWEAIIAISLIYVITTVILMETYVMLALKGFEVARMSLLEHYENLIIGLVLVILGALNFIMQ
ncbi:MAG: hypothetical protein ABIL16_05285 [candidate division WOR-3 bacterium]